MPTGYTADIPDGIDFRTYAMNCARAFGACITLRDEPGRGEAIPDEFAPSEYSLNAMEQARGELGKLAAMTAEQRDLAASKSWDDAETSRVAQLQKIRATRASYEAMLLQVDDWVPPTEDHIEFRNFMAQQIKESMRFDCNEDYYSAPTPRLNGGEWATKEEVRIRRDIAYHEKAHAEEIERTAQRNSWVRALRESLR